MRHSYVGLSMAQGETGRYTISKLRVDLFVLAALIRRCPRREVP